MLPKELLHNLTRNKETTLSLISQIKESMLVTGIGKFLRAKGQVQLFDPAHDPHIQSAKAAFSAGYLEALDDLEYFIERFVERVDINADLKIPNLDFGAESTLIERGRTTREALDYYREHGTWPKMKE